MKDILFPLSLFVLGFAYGVPIGAMLQRRKQRRNCEQIRALEYPAHAIGTPPLETCDCDRTVIHDCVCPQCRERYLVAHWIDEIEYRILTGK